MAAGATVLVIGSGGREHALAWKLSRSPRVSRVIVAPGNDGMARGIPGLERWEARLGLTADALRAEFERLATRALEEKVALVVVGPDNPLADGIVDTFEARGLRCFGPVAAAARIEASKAFAKEIMQAAGVPTARSHVTRSAEEARELLRGIEWGSGWVVKADGLALGKGVFVCSTREEALAAVAALSGDKSNAALSGDKSNAALSGDKSNAALSGDALDLVIEERLQGEELSWMAFCDGERCALLEPARDHKRLRDGDQGPNTGGMGAYSPVPGVPADWAERVRREVFEPTLAELKRRGTPFRGLLYAGLMVDIPKGKIWVLEFNARFGDPETQALMLRMQDDLYGWCLAVAHGDLSSRAGSVAFRPVYAAAIVGAARGYPDAPEKGAELRAAGGAAARLPSTTELPSAPECFYAGVARAAGTSGRLLASGGRVLAVTGEGETLSQACAAAYARLESGVGFEGMQYRKDIGQGGGMR